MIRRASIVALGSSVALALALQASAQTPSISVPPPGLDASSQARDEAPPPAPPNATVEQPRAFGYVIGDVLTQRVLLNLRGREFTPAELPLPGRAGVWFERRGSHIDRDAVGRRWLGVDYQLINSPQALRVVTLPAWQLKPAASTDEELRVGAWQISISPLTPERPVAQPGLGSLRPDRTAPPIILGPMRSGFFVGLIGLLITALAWATWLAWRNWRASSAEPFARAMRDMRGLDGASPEAWRALHRAFDATSGRATRVDSLAELFRRAPHFMPLRSEIEEFFRQSAARFYAEAPVSRPVSARALGRALRRIEKRHER